MDQKIEVAVYLPDSEAQKWLVFQEHYTTFGILVDSGVFDVTNGSVSLHFDSQGTLQTVQRSDFLYSRKHS